MVLRGKDSGGDQGDCYYELYRKFEGVFVKQQLGSLDFVEGLIKKKMALLANAVPDNGIEAVFPL